MDLLHLKRTHIASSLAAFVTIMATGALLSPAVLAAPPTNIEGVGKPFTGSFGIARTTADLMRYDQLHPGPKEPILVPDHEGPEREELPVSPASPRVASIPQLPPDMLTGYRPKGQRFEVLSPQTIGPNVKAATLSGINPTNAFPPDCDGAIGPTQFIVAVNGRIVSLDKTTGAQDGVLNLSTNNFFNSVRGASGTSDPQIRYDRLSARWFVMIINVPTDRNSVLIGVSDAASAGVISPSTVWRFFAFNAITTPPAISNTCFADYPSMGIDANALYIGTDNFCPTFNSTDGFVVRKSSILGAGPIVVTAFRGLMTSPTFVGPFAPRGVDNYDPTSNEGYFLGVDGAVFGQLDMYRISDPGGTPGRSANIPIAVPTTSNPLSVPHLGNTNPGGGSTGNVDALDDRPFYVFMRDHQMWTAQNIAVDNTGLVNATPANNTRDGSRWYQFNVPVGSGTPAIVQSGIVFTATANNLTSERHYFVPSIMVSGQGHAAMAFSTAGSLESINCGTVGRLANDPLGTMQTPVLLTGSGTAYNPPNDTGASRGRRRWGDYSVTSVDPLDDMSIWTAQMYCDATNSYGVQVAKMIAPVPAVPSALSDLPPGNSSLNVTLTGTTASGSAFFDPGTDLSPPAVPYTHLSASITNGTATGTPPALVSATYVNPTTVNLVLNTLNATPNVGAEKYTITVTNPDGQTSSAAIVHVVDPTITASAGAGGTISSPGTVSVPYNSTPTYSISANPCFSISDVLVDGSSVGAVSSYTFPPVKANHTISASFVAGLTNPTAGLTAAQVKTGNGPGTRTGIMLTFTPGAGATTVEVWRKGYGNYPTYSGGSTPPLPGSYPPPGWTLTGVTASGQTDVPPTRDFWYYVAYGRDGCSDTSPVSNMTAGTLDYHLGDVSDGSTPGTGNNTINTADASLLGGHYGASGGALTGFEYLDFGPTTDFTTDGRPTPDGTVDFEDLVLLSLNYTPAVSLVARGPAVQNPGATINQLAMKVPYLVTAGQVIEVPVELTARGDLHAVSVALGWDPSVVTPIETVRGEFVVSQGGVVLPAGPAGADAALLGTGRGLAGQGVLATMRFRAVKDGDPQFIFEKVIGRDVANKPVAINARNPVGREGPVTATVLHPVIPNPSRGTSFVRYDLSTPGQVELSIYSVDGRHVKTLARGPQEAGRYHFTWNGADDRGTALRSGLYFVRLDAAGTRRTRLMTLIR